MELEKIDFFELKLGGNYISFRLTPKNGHVVLNARATRLLSNEESIFYLSICKAENGCMYICKGDKNSPTSLRFKLDTRRKNGFGISTSISLVRFILPPKTDFIKYKIADAPYEFNGVEVYEILINEPISTKGR